MSLQGDLSTLDLAGLLQNLEAAQKQGLLTIKTKGGEAKLYFEKGRLALFSTPGRASLVDMLQASGAVSQSNMEAAKKRRKRNKKLIGETLDAMGFLSADQLKEFATARLMDEACELVASGGGAFQFTEGGVPRGVFDPEERALQIALPAGPLLLESARREDHWKLIRDRVPADSLHYVVQHSPREPAKPEAAQLQKDVLALLDGTRSVAEVLAGFPHKRFEVYQLLADLSDAQAIRIAAPGDMNRLVREIARNDRQRAWAILERGLLAHPRNPNLLMTKALLAQEIGELESAAEALKVLVHQHLQAGEQELALKGIERLKGLDPDDAFVWERSFLLALQDKRKPDAIHDGKRLVELYRGPGLFKKACGVLEKLVELDPGSWELVRDLAKNRADGGDRSAAVLGLEKFGGAHLEKEEYGLARRVYEEILNLEPDNQTAKETVASIKSGELAERIEKRKRLRRRIAAVVGTIAICFWLWYEAEARIAYVQATQEISQQRLIEITRYQDAIEIYREMKQAYPLSTTALYDVRRQIEELKRKAGQK